MKYLNDSDQEFTKYVDYVPVIFFVIDVIKAKCSWAPLRHR